MGSFVSYEENEVLLNVAPDQDVFFFQEFKIPDDTAAK
jgi:hypothetical protein